MSDHAGKLLDGVFYFVKEMKTANTESAINDQNVLKLRMYSSNGLRC